MLESGSDGELNQRDSVHFEKQLYENQFDKMSKSQGGGYNKANDAISQKSSPKSNIISNFFNINQKDTSHRKYQMYELYDDNSTAIDLTKKGSVPTNKIVPLHGMGISKFSEGVSDLD